MKKNTILFFLSVLLAAIQLPLFAATCTIGGKITLPLASTGKSWFVVVDTDMNGGNGITQATGGITSGSNQINYNITVPDGTYYVYAVVDENNNASQPDDGDYFGINGAIWPSFPAAANVVVTCPTGGTFDITAVVFQQPTPTPTNTVNVNACEINGTITLPFSSTGKNWYLIVDTDLDGDNGRTAIIGGQTSGSTINYNVSVESGTYYIFAIVDENATTGPPDIGDYVGFYGSLYPSMPGAANAIVTCPAGGTYDITATLMQPTPTATPGGCTISGTVTLPAISSGKTWFVLLDNDTYGDTFITADMGTTNGTDQFTYTISIGPGTYYIYTAVDENNSGGEPDGGDYLGFYGTVFPSVPGVANAVVDPCPATSGPFDITAGTIPLPSYTPTVTSTITPGGPTATVTPTSGISTVSGTITMPAASLGMDAIVILDDDQDGGNGYLFSWTGTTNGTAQFSYSMTATTGTYYVFSFIDENSSGMGSGPDIGDYAGFYGGGPGWHDAPGTANAVVTAPFASFDFSTVFILPPTATNTPTSTLTKTFTPTITATWTPTAVDSETNTPVNTATNTPVNTATNTPVNTATNTPVNTATNTPVNTATNTPVNTSTNTPVNTATNTPVNTSTNTPVNTSTNTPVNTSTNTPVNTSTNTPVNTSTDTPMNTPTNTPVNTATYTPTFTRTFTGTYTPTETATSSFTATPTFTATMISPATDLSVWHGSLAPLNVGIGQTGVWFMAISLYNDAIPGSASLRVGGVTITAVDGLGAPLALSSALDRVSIVDVSGMTVYSTVNVSLYASQDVYLEFSIPVDVPAANTRTVYVSADISLTPAFTACRLRVKDAAAFAASNLPSGAITVSAGQGDAFPMDSNPVTLVVFTETYTITETATETPYYSPTGTPTDTASATASVSPSNTYTGTPTDTPIDTITASPTVTMTNTPTLTPTPTAYVSPTITPTAGQPDAGPGKSYCYPQPAHDWLRIVYSLPAAETVTIKIYNFAGIPVDSETDIGAAGDANMKEIDIKKFSPGIYFYLVKRSNVLPMTGKFLVVK